jgi:hypothetical protein
MHTCYMKHLELAWEGECFKRVLSSFNICYFGKYFNFINLLFRATGYISQYPFDRLQKEFSLILEATIFENFMFLETTHVLDTHFREEHGCEFW